MAHDIGTYGFVSYMGGMINKETKACLDLLLWAPSPDVMAMCLKESLTDFRPSIVRLTHVALDQPENDWFCLVKVQMFGLSWRVWHFRSVWIQLNSMWNFFPAVFSTYTPQCACGVQATWQRVKLKAISFSSQHHNHIRPNLIVWFVLHHTIPTQSDVSITPVAYSFNNQQQPFKALCLCYCRLNIPMWRKSCVGR